MKKRVGAGVGASVGAILGVPAVAQADDLKVTNLNDSGQGSLREAIADANSDDDADRILFKSKLSGTIELSGTSDLDIDEDLNIVGPGARRVAVTRVGEGGSIFQVFTSTAQALDVTISGLALTDTESKYTGGAIGMYSYTGPTDLTLSRVTISGNAATGAAAPVYGDGGGVSAKGDGEGRLTIENSTITGNEAGTGGGDYGGGIYTSDVDLTLTNSTVSGNDAGEDGGGLYLRAGSNSTIRNSTVAFNTAVTDDAGGIWIANSPTRLEGTIVADNQAANGTHDLVSVNSPFTSAFSLIGDTTQSVVSPPIVDEGGNLLGVDPKLKPLKDNGGPTDTHAFKKSPAKNKIPKGQTPKNDQRGAKRKGKGDIGAYELVKCEGVIVNVVGTAGKDKLKGTKKKDGILGLGGNDKLSGKKGKDGLCGGSGKDKLKGGPGKDKLNGGPGKDKEIQ